MTKLALNWRKCLAECIKIFEKVPTGNYAS